MMNYFISGINEGINEIVSQSDWGIGFLYDSLSKANNLSQKIGLFTEAVILIQFNMFLFLLFSIIGVLFFARHIAIWILTILSPLAFVAWVLPQTKKFWDMWWQQLIQWSILGIVFMFFIYLATASYGALTTSFGVKVADFTPDPANNAWLNQLMPLLTVCAIISIGFVLGLKTSAMGAEAILGKAIDYKKKAQSWFTGKVWKGINAPDRRINVLDRGKPAENLRTLSRKIAKGWDAAPVIRWFRPEPLKKFGEQDPVVQAAEKNITGPSEDEMDRLANGKYTGAVAAAALHTIIKDRGDSQDVIEAYKRKYKVKTEEELFSNEKFLNDKTLNGALEYLDQAGMKSKALRIDPRLEMIGKSREEGLKAMEKKVIDAKTGDITIMEREVLDNKDFLEMVMAHKDETHFRVMSGLKGGWQGRQDRIDDVFTKFVKDNNLDPRNDEKNWDKYLDSLCKRFRVERKEDLGIAKATNNPRLSGIGVRKGRFRATVPAEAIGLGQQLSQPPAQGKEKKITDAMDETKNEQTILDAIKKDRKKKK